ncbi:LptA/OstA family protein, partial [Phenylobacterium sp.]|uniref:LptA/OstA family protein n=1 Tax=Phenylobacterium sp. TaxID=1871053 RepID=UPI0025D00201
MKRALLAGAAAAVLWPCVVLAQPEPGTPYEQSPLSKDQRGQILNDSARGTDKPRPAAPEHTDGLKPGELYIEADQLSRDAKNGITTAEGHVEVRYEDRTLRADRLVYKEPPPLPEGQARTPRDKEAPAQGVIRAYGHVQIIHDDGEVENATEMTLDDKMQAAVALGFSESMKDKRTAQEWKISSDTAVRRSEELQELNEAIVTPCNICVGKTPKTPTWSISADRVLEDKVR